MALKVDLLQDRKISSSQARPCFFQSGNLTAWGSEVVNAAASREGISLPHRNAVILVVIVQC